MDNREADDAQLQITAAKGDWNAHDADRRRGLAILEEVPA